MRIPLYLRIHGATRIEIPVTYSRTDSCHVRYLSGKHGAKPSAVLGSTT